MGYEPRQGVGHGFPDIHARVPVFDDRLNEFMSQESV